MDRRLLIVLLALLVAAPASAREPLTVPVDARKLGPRIPQHFMGFSGEFGILRAYLAYERRAIANPVLVRLWRNLAAFGGGMPVLRLGGGQTDYTYYDDGVPEERGPQENYALGPHYLNAIKAFLLASGSPAIIGVNLAVNRPERAAEWAQAVMSALPTDQVKALEIGNEPDTYPKFGLRPQGWGPADYLQELDAYEAALRQVEPRLPLAGPAMIASDPEWLGIFPAIAGRDHHMDLMTIHRYPVFACGREFGTHRAVDPRELLRPAASDDFLRGVAQVVQIAAQAGKRVRISESNSVACGGAHGASDTFAASLWGADWLFMMALAGVEGVDFHSTSRAYQPFAVPRDQQNSLRTYVRPLFYGMQLFAEATAHRARLIPSTYPYPYQRPYRVHTWGTYDKVDRVVRVAVINKSGRRQPVRLDVRGARRGGSLKRLSAPSMRSLTGISWGGQAYADPTDGHLQGRRAISRVRRGPKGRFVVRMPRYGAALLTVPVRRRG